ncbi:SPOR domain-containing protein [uncultured Acetobacteroides sp.]|uniref:SPOR domain-containing protein n=1 Tax=uncultured Acetobacteroides sp. TaxID=1760811 RepID=UPI0029F4D72C|nr:SPOR domain-containing protein [uncultured Acetobacteroides sp.]
MGDGYHKAQLVVHLAGVWLSKLKSQSQGVLLLLLLWLFPSVCLMAQDKFTDETVEMPITYDEVSVLVTVDRLSEFYAEALYSSNDRLYVSIEGLFGPLGIPYIVSAKGDSISGYIGAKRQPYLIDYSRQRVSVGGKEYSFRGGLVSYSGMLYMESSLFGGTFGLDMTFNFRSLILKVKPNFELPIFKQQQLEAMRKNIAKVKGEVVADTVVSRSYHLFKPGMVDWSVASYQKWKGETTNSFGLGVGTELLYGEANVSAYYNDRYKFSDRNLYYLWRWVDNDKTLIRQAQVGRISNQTIAFINAPIVGVAVRNTPTTVRKAKGYYTINEVAEPNWTVELYINNVLVDYTKTDASGAYTFKVPIVYGYTTLKLKFYGPLGEERTEERTMNMPYTVMPVGEFEYGLSGGVLQDSTNSRYGRAEFNYGVSRFLTVGGGVEYLSSITSGAYIPFAKATVQPLTKMIISGEYDHDVKAQGLLSYYFWKDALIELDYAKFKEGQKATLFNALEERKVRLSVPFRLRNISFNSRIDYNQLVYSSVSYNQANVMLSLYYRQFSANSSTMLNWIEGSRVYATSNLALSYRLRNGVMIRPSAYGNITDGKLISWRTDIEKNFSKGYLTATYERNVASSNDYISLSFKYDLSFARTNLTASRSQGSYYTSQSAQGSLAFGGGNGYVYTSNNPSVGKGGLVVYPFLDLNQNGVFDKGERMVKLTSVKIPGGKVIFSKKDSIVRITELNPFVDYMMEFDDSELDNISWRFKHKTYKVLVDPNQFKRVDVPIIVVGEANGMVSLNSNNNLKGLGRILVKIYRKGGGKPVAEMLSESDGYISYVGLAQGDYVACVDSTQLQRLDYASTPRQISFTIKALEEGDVVSILNFTLSKKNDENTLVEKASDKSSSNSSSGLPLTSAPMEQPSSIKAEGAKNSTTGVYGDGIGIEAKGKLYASSRSQAPRVSTKKNVAAKLLWGEVCAQGGNYCVQCGSFRIESNAMRYAKTLKKEKEMSVGVILHRGFYKVRVGCIPSKKCASSIKRMVSVKDSLDEPLIVKRKINGV